MEVSTRFRRLRSSASSREEVLNIAWRFSRANVTSFLSFSFVGFWDEEECEWTVSVLILYVYSTDRIGDIWNDCMVGEKDLIEGGYKNGDRR